MQFRNMRRRWLALGLLGLSGCGAGGSNPTAAERPFRGVKVVVAAFDAPAFLKIVASQRGEGQDTQGAEAAIQQTAVDPQSFKAPGLDVLLFTGDSLGDVVDAGALAVLPDSLVRPSSRVDAEPAPDAATPEPARDALEFSDILLPFRDQVAKYGSDLMALPCGTSALVLVYRRDALQRAENRAAAETASLTLEPPRTWEQFDALAKFFHGRDWDGDGKVDYGVGLALGSDAEGLGEDIFLARAAALGQHPHQYSFLFDADTMEPRIASPPFVAALASLVAMKTFGPPGMERYDAEAAREAFRSGQVAFLIDRAEQASRWSDPKQPIQVGVAALPGSLRVYDPERRVWETATSLNRPGYLTRGGGWLVGL